MRLLQHVRTILRPRAVLTEALIVVTLFAVTVGERAYLASQRKIMEAGDTFNFLSLAQAYSQGRLVKGEKRLPLYPLAIMVGWKGLGIDPMVAATGIGVLAGGGTIVLLYLLGRRMSILPLPLAAFLLLWLLEPVTNSVGIRPLSDALFLFLVVAATYAVTVATGSVRSALMAGGAIVLLMLTRFESMVLAPVLVLLLRLRMSWRRVLLAALPVLALYAAWIPYSLYIHGTIGGGYFTEFSAKEGAVGGKLEDVPPKLRKIAGGVGWLRPWENANYVLENPDPKRTPLQRILSSGSWWVGMLAILGVPWLLLTAKKSALPFFGVFFAFGGLYSMWVVYGRFVAPSMPAFYVSAAAGASALYVMARQLFQPRAIAQHSWRSPSPSGVNLIGEPGYANAVPSSNGKRRVWREKTSPSRVFAWALSRGVPRLLHLAAALGITAFLLWIVDDESSGLMKVTTNRVFDNEGSGFSLVLAIRELTQREGRAAFNHDLMAIIYLGIVGEPLAPPQRAIMLGEAPEVEKGKTVEDKTREQVAQLRQLDIRYLVERDEPRMLRILDVLKQHGVVTATEEIRYPKGRPPGPDFDVTRIHTLTWEKV